MITPAVITSTFCAVFLDMNSCGAPDSGVPSMLSSIIPVILT